MQRQGRENERGPTDEEAFQLAAAYVSDAQFARNIPFQTARRCIWYYRLYTRWVTWGPMYMFLALNLALAFLETPAKPQLESPLWVTMLLESLCLVAFSVRLVHLAKFTERSVFWKDPKNICVLVTIILTVIDMVIYVALTHSGYYIVRWSRALRPLFVINFSESRQLRRSFRNIRRTLPEILGVLVLFLFSIAIFSLMAFKLFGKRHLITGEGKPYFQNYLNIFFELYVLVTTSNSPDVMMPAYNSSSWYAIFFIIYIVVNTYLFMSIFLAVVYNNYRKHLKNEVRNSVFSKRRTMAKAFGILRERLGEGWAVSQHSWMQLVGMAVPSMSQAQRLLLWQVSDEEHTGHIGKQAFVRLTDLLNIEVIETRGRQHPLQSCAPRVYSSAASQALRHVVHHRFFRYFFDGVILLNAGFIAGDEASLVIRQAEWLFLGLYVLEILLKLYTYEPQTFFSRSNFWNWFDVMIVVSALLATIIVHSTTSSTQILDFLLIIRVLRLLRIVESFERFRVVIHTMINIGPTMVTYAGLVMVFYYTFAILGMELFQGKIRFFPAGSSDAQPFCGNPLLNGSKFYNEKYCKNNFNDLSSSFVLLVELTVVNQWHVLASGFVAVTNVGARVYFILFHMIVVILVINIFIAFILEAFILEYTLDKGETESAIEKKIQELGWASPSEDAAGNGMVLVDNMETQDQEPSGVETSKPAGSRIMFKISDKRYRTVDTLLQRMFEEELAPEYEGPCDEHEDIDVRPQQLTLDNLV
ncbi:two pore calcium channel protein 1-like isoform X2 [Lethenteron reissneri]|uniref:two pore calcium channel protein 1-like isoform X2 n=1 Tax=Lethenteron reissneri TaxID=7753 RepID=UPI002AB7746D|nr:two pore calcium channel protein 1-like isoform X2 [Lethenteron reissneri]